MRNRFSSIDFWKIAGAIPLLFFIALLVILDSQEINYSLEKPFLLAILNMVFLCFIPLFLSFLAAKSHITTESFSFMLLGCGFVIFGFSSLLAGWVMPLSASGPNPTVTLHNLGSLFAGLCQVLGAHFVLSEIMLNKKISYRKSNIFIIYTAIIIVISLLGVLVFQQHLPLFFDQATGPTLLRQIILGAAIFLFAAAGFIFLEIYFTTKTELAFWYGQALLLIAAGLGYVFLQHKVGGLMGWTGRAAQYIGCLYFIIAFIKGRHDISQADIKSNKKSSWIFWPFLEQKIIESTSALVALNLKLQKEITERKLAEEKLYESKKRFKSIIENSSAGYFFIDCDGHYQNVNTAWLKMHKYDTPEEILGRHFSVTQIDENQSKADKIVKQLLSGKVYPQGEFKRLCKDGSIAWHTFSINPVYLNGVVIGLEGFLIDITDSKIIYEKLKKIEERLQFAMVTSQIGIWDLDLVDHTAFRSIEHDRTFGYDELLPEWTYDMFLEHVLPEDRIMVDDKFQNAIKTQSDWNFECRIRRKDDEVRWIWAAGRHLIDNTAAVRRMTGIVQDITERKQTEEKIKSLLSEKEIILKEVNHRIKNNMNTIFGMLYLQANTLKDPSAIEALEDAASRVQSMAVLFDKLYHSHNVQKISLKSYFEPLIDEIIMNFPNSKSVKIEKKIEDIELHAKKLQPLGIIINELLTNIMKYAFTGRNNGIIIVEAHFAKTDEIDGINPATKDNTPTVYITIQDNGNGMPDSVDFENSTGFGLQLVWMLTKDLKGEIQIERGNGTKIILEFKV